jgi:hypothetical protein
LYALSQNGSVRNTANDINNISGALFICLVFMGYSNAAGVLPIIANARTVFYREKAANMYCVEAFALANVSLCKSPVHQSYKLY